MICQSGRPPNPAMAMCLGQNSYSSVSSGIGKAKRVALVISGRAKAATEHYFAERGLANAA